MASTLMILILSIGALLHDGIGIRKAQLDIGVNYGVLGDILPSSDMVVHLHKRYNIGKM